MSACNTFKEIFFLIRHQISKFKLNNIYICFIILTLLQVTASYSQEKQIGRKAKVLLCYDNKVDLYVSLTDQLRAHGYTLIRSLHDEYYTEHDEQNIYLVVGTKSLSKKMRTCLERIPQSKEIAKVLHDLGEKIGKPLSDMDRNHFGIDRRIFESLSVVYDSFTYFEKEGGYYFISVHHLPNIATIVNIVDNFDHFFNTIVEDN
ncbi:hypothetical protein [Polycladidibacter hongkongensis]|uniref:hypothetical protein n=1 Tax=Polycladidibacter hongkongensis TaxID=1647556 RepID=UPI00082B4A1E|nr:hypothetical protein [Pseudovibrio hongkongensis]